MQQPTSTTPHRESQQYGPHHPKTIHFTASAMQQAFADRAEYLGDTDFVRVQIPYATKLFIQELMTMGTTLRMFTEK